MKINFKFINTGSSRLVFLIGKYAIKIPRCCVKPDNTFYGKLLGFLWGWEANRVEYKWSKSKTYDFLNPVKFSILGSIIIVFDRARVLTDIEFMDLNKDDFPFGKFEFKTDSFGFVNGVVKILDYGN